MEIYNAVLKQFNTLEISLDNISDFKSYEFQIINGTTNLIIEKYSVVDNSLELVLNKDIDIKNESFIIYKNIKEKINYFPLFKSKDFDDKFYHDLSLGCIYNKNYTIFRLWSPPAAEVTLLLFHKGEPSKDEKVSRIPLKENNGLWSVVLREDLKGYYYNYETKIYGKINEAVDPYARAVGVNGLRGSIINMDETNPENWAKDFSPELKNYTDAIIYETSIRDISSHVLSGVINKGKFLAFTENNTKSNKNLSTCLSHIKDLGITHIQLMPFFDFSHLSVDEKNPVKYNWGYDPQNYNVPEGSYSTNPDNPVCRILELKKAINNIHSNNLSINMDVVYNHIWNVYESNFEKIFPGYYFRVLDNGTLSNGSGCGNDTASEHTMVRKYIIDSIIYWAKEYHIDGFRFDLMGLYDITTINLIRKKLDELNRPIMLYGEGWDLNTSLSENLRATQNNDIKLPSIGFFNDKIRNHIKGDIFDIYDRGFATGKKFIENDLKESICGDFSSADKSINYVSCHDNHTLWDKIDLSCKDYSIDDKKRMVKLCASIIFTSQGIPFIYSGEEFCRSKKGSGNSFNKSDDINSINWNLKYEFIDVFSYYQKLIHIRKNHNAFRMVNNAYIKKHLFFLNNTPENLIAFILKDHANGDTWKDILVIFNANNDATEVSIPYGTWTIALDSNLNSNNKSFTGNNIKVDKISTIILFTE